MKRARGNIDSDGALGDLMLYGVIAAILATLAIFHAFCAFVAAGVVTKGFAGDWQQVLSGFLHSWAFARWSVGIPALLFIIQYMRIRFLSGVHEGRTPAEYVMMLESSESEGPPIYKIGAVNGSDYLDYIYAETAKMCNRAKLRMPELFRVSADHINAYTIEAHNGAHAVVLYDGLLRRMHPCDSKAVVAHELGHIISRDNSSGKRLGYAIAVLETTWEQGQDMISKARDMMSPPGGRQANPVEWLGGLGMAILGGMMAVLGGLAHYCASGLNWVRDHQAEFVADSRGATLLDDERDMADMMVVLQCAKDASETMVNLALKFPVKSQLLLDVLSERPVAGKAPGKVFGRIDVHPPSVDRVRRLRPSFDGDFRGAYEEILKRRSGAR
ncbi:MAG: M48 family metalloprotease [Kiritimatiellae bacterium]|nr:M48 family metalloprotease [Kiritimatiellia bacterium]